jgi:hypothetical protein
MRRFLCVGFILLLSAWASPELSAQGSPSLPGASGGSQQIFRVLQNFPNPIQSETRIPFELYEGAFPEGAPAVVSARIYNVLRELVEVPTTLGYAMGDGIPVIDLEYGTPGRHELYWNGMTRSGATAAPGVYLLEMTVNGRPQILKMVVQR